MISRRHFFGRSGRAFAAVGLAGAMRTPGAEPQPADPARGSSDYYDRLGRTLDADQRKAWDDKGFGNAFGDGAMSKVGAAAINVYGSPPAFRTLVNVKTPNPEPRLPDAVK